MANAHAPEKFDRLRRMARKVKPQHLDCTSPTHSEMLELIQDLNNHQLELEIQNEELKQAQLELADLYQQFEDMYEFAPCGYLNLNSSGLINQINLAGISLLKGLRERVLHTGFTDYITDGCQTFYLKALRKTGQTGEKQSLELELRSPHGPPTWVWAEILADRMKTGATRRWRITLVDISAKKAVEAAIVSSEKKYRLLFGEMVSAAAILEVAEWDSLGRPIDIRILEVNPAFERLTGISRDHATGRCIRQIWPRTEKVWFDHFDRLLRSDQPEQVEGFHRETEKHYLASGFRLDGNRVGMTFIDVSAHKKFEAVQEQYRQELEIQVERRTNELRRSNAKLNDEIVSRKKVQQQLLEKSQELEVRSAGLEKANITLQVLLKERENERRKLEEKVVCNLNELTRPHLAKLASGKLSPSQRTVLNAAGRSLDDITSPLSRRFIIEGRRLTPAESRVANLIRQGKSTKEISGIMGVATSTINYHRLNIRRRLGISNQKVNLQSYLRSIL